MAPPHFRRRSLRNVLYEVRSTLWCGSGGAAVPPYGDIAITKYAVFSIGPELRVTTNFGRVGRCGAAANSMAVVA